MNDMRHLYGMPKTASAQKQEFKDVLRGYFHEVAQGNRPFQKTASEKSAIIRDMIKEAAQIKQAGTGWNRFKRGLSEMGAGIAQGARNVAGDIGRSAKGMYSRAKDNVVNAYDSAVDNVQRGVEAVENTARNAYNGAAQYVNDVKTGVGAYAREGRDSAVSAGNRAKLRASIAAARVKSGLANAADKGLAAVQRGIAPAAQVGDTLRNIGGFVADKAKQIPASYSEYVAKNGVNR